MTAAELLGALREQGVELWCEGERLRFRAPKGALGAEQKAALSAERAGVISVLRAEGKNTERRAPISFSQQSLWFLHQQAPASAAYHVALPMRIASPVDIATLAHAVQALADRHASLRTTYGFDEQGALKQRIAGALDVPLAQHAVPGLGDAEMRRAVEEEYLRPFDLENGPLFRVSLFTRAHDDHVLLVTVHHIAADGWSVMILLDELFKLYAEATGAPAGLARPASEYANYVSWQHEMLAGPEGERLWNYWRDKLAGSRGQLGLPTDRPRPAVQSFVGSSHPFELTVELTQGIKGLATDAGTTPFVVLLAAFHAFLFRLTGDEDVIVGTPTFGRSKAEFMQVVGDFVNSVPLRAKLAAKLPFRELVTQLKSTVVEAVEAQAFPLPVLVQRLAPERDSNRSPLFDTLFILQRFDRFREFQTLLAGKGSEPPVEIGGLRVAPFPIGQQEGQFDLGLEMVDHEGVFHAVLKYSVELFDADTTERFALGYTAILAAAAQRPDVPLGELPAPDRPRVRETPEALIARLRTLDVHLFVESGKLRVNAPKGALTDELRATIGARRDDLVRTLESASEGTGRAAVVKPIARVSPLPVSSAQQRLWFLDRMAPGSSVYNIGASMRLRGRLDAAAFERAVDALVERHESLRTHIEERDGAPLVVIREGARAGMQMEDVSHLPPSEAEAEAIRRADELTRAPFDVARGPLARYCLFRLAPDHHVFTLCLHHIIADGWSVLIAGREITETYHKLVTGRPHALPPAALQYVDYAGWERAQLHSGRLSKDLAYWKQALAGAPALLELPTDRPRSATSGAHGHRFRKLIDMRLIETLKQVSRKQEATLYMLLLAAFQVLLHRYSGQQDLVVGSPVANRNVPEFEGIIGCFVNNMVVRSRISRDTTFAEMLRDVKAATLGALDHHELPFDVLVEAVKPERNANHTPIFQVLFALQTYLTDVPTTQGITSEQLDPTDLGIARFDLSLDLAEFRGEFSALYEYSTDLFDVETIQRMHAHFERVLAAIAADVNQKVESLPILAPSDEALLLGKWNETELEHDRMRCLHSLVERQARAIPDAVAIADGERSLTYRALDERANQLAHLLAQRGVSPGSLVAVCLDRTVDIPVALAAVLKCGAAYVPLDPAHPADRLRYTLEDAGVACAVTLRRFASLLDGGPPLVVLDEAVAELESMPTGAVSVPVRPEDRAYVIYTSGSTGKPKGVEVEHRNVVSFLEAMRKTPGFGPEDRLLAVTTLSFDIAGLEFWLPLSTGATVFVASRTDVLEGERLAAILEERRVTVLQATPATFRLLIESGWAGKRDLKVLCGGEAFPRDLAAALLVRVAELWNVYGPTETTIWSTVSRITDAEAPLTIGRPIQNTRTYILEPSGLPSPIGVPGELCIAGEGVARGYHDRPELTAEKFVTLTLPGGKTERAYRTGDVARYRGDGTIDYLGRRDQQVKVRGYRIELGEIESVLATHPGVKECVVAVREVTPGDQRLIGYVVTGSAPFELEAARTTLRAKLPEYMVPNQFMTLAALPLTPNGKVDRKALPAPNAVVAPAVDEAAEALMTPVQRRVAGSWREVLRIDRVGLYDNFFDIGGHSLLLVKLHAALKREFSSDLRLVELFQWTTVAAQAARLSAAAPTDAAVRRAQSRAARLTDG